MILLGINAIILFHNEVPWRKPKFAVQKSTKNNYMKNLFDYLLTRGKDFDFICRLIKLQTYICLSILHTILVYIKFQKKRLQLAKVQ